MIVAPNNNLPTATGSGKIVYDSGSGVYSLCPGITTDGRKFDLVATSTNANILTLTSPASYTGLFYQAIDSAGSVRFRVDSNGGVTSLASDGSTPAAYGAYTYNTSTANGGAFGGFTARGTISAPTATQSGDLMVIFAGGGYTGSSFAGNKAVIRMHTAENWSSTAQGTDIYFGTTKKTTTTRTDRMRISSEGDVVVNPTGVSISTNANNGYLYFSSCAGVPVGSPPAYTGATPLVYDSANKALWIYDGSQWASSRRGNVTTTSGPTTLTAKDDFVVANPNGAGYTITLPTATSHKGRNVIIKAIPGISGVLNIAVSSGDYIDGTLNGSTSINTGGVSCVQLFSDGAGTWFTISRQ